MSQEQIASRLKQAMGLHSDTVGMVTVSNAINRRMTETGTCSHGEYLLLIDSDPGELQQLIETVIIPETWFFRDDSPYEHIVKHVNKRISSGSILPVNILSIPCSTGEEPYSIAMSLDEAHISPDQYRINAFDISLRNIERARTALYRKNSFRSSRLDFIEKYFVDNGADYQLSEKIKRNVQFSQGNVLDDNFVRVENIYDVILCRNLLIYFDKPTQLQVFKTLYRMLKSDGILVLGHAETHHASGNLFEPIGDGLSYIFRKYKKQKKIPHAETRVYPTPRRTTANNFATTVKPFANVDSFETKLKEEVSATEAFELANAGKTAEAREACMNMLDADSNNASAYYLLGLIDDIEGNAGKAEENFRKCIYLEPEHYEALVHLSLMLEQRGENSAASRFRQRAQKSRDKVGVG